MLIFPCEGIHEFALIILPRSLFNILMDLSYSAFVSKLFISNDSFIIRSCILDNFENVFGSSQLNRRWKSLQCLVVPDASHFLVILSSWCSIDRVSTRCFVSPMYSLSFVNCSFFQKLLISQPLMLNQLGFPKYTRDCQI